MIDAEKMIAWVRAFEEYRAKEQYRILRRESAPALVAATVAITEHVSLGRDVEEAIGTHSTLLALEDETTDPELRGFLRDAIKRAAIVAAEVIVATVTARKAVETEAPDMPLSAPCDGAIPADLGPFLTEADPAMASDEPYVGAKGAGDEIAF